MFRRSAMKITSSILPMVAVVFLACCSSSSEALTREEQEAKFTRTFGFSPPPIIKTIEYADLSSRGVMNGGYGQWLMFTFDQDSYDKIILAGYTRTQLVGIPNSKVAPTWWPASVPNGSAIFSRSHDDTPKDEGFSFKEYLWYNESSGLVFFHKNYWG